jgi:hypothetical protein
VILGSTQAENDEVDCGADSFPATVGTFMYLPRGVPHSYTVGPAPAAKLILTVPAASRTSSPTSALG